MANDNVDREAIINRLDQIIGLIADCSSKMELLIVMAGLADLLLEIPEWDFMYAKMQEKKYGARQ